MKQLGTLDSAFINLENRNTPQHIGGLGIYDPSTAPGGEVRFKEVLSNFEQRLRSLPLFRTRLVQVPGDIDRPYWVEDSNFDVEFHIRHISLPSPGDWRQLWIQTARLHARSLDLARPLWEVYVIEGLDNIEGLPEGAFAMYTKMHHSMIDGAGGASFMAALHDLEADPKPSAKQAQTIIVDRDPNAAELVARAMFNNLTGSFSKVRGVAKAATALAKYQLQVSRDEVPPLDIAAPSTRFNKKVGPHRVAEAALFPLSDFKAIKKAVGVTVNDVALGVIGGAMRRYLISHNELPEESLVATIPVNTRNQHKDSDENNHVGSMFADLHTHLGDPIARLQAVRESTAIAKKGASSNPMSEALRVAGFFSPAVSKAAANIWAKNHLSQYLPTNISTVITNVPGPNFPLYCAGAELVRYHGLGLLTPGCGVFHTVFSSNGKVTVTVLSDRGIMPDPEMYRKCLEASFEEMLAAVNVSEPMAELKKAKVTKTKINTHKEELEKANQAQGKQLKDTQVKAKPAKKAARKKAPTKKPTLKAKLGKNVQPMSSEQVSARPAKKKRSSLRDFKIPDSAKRTTTSRKKPLTSASKPTTSN